MSKKPSQDELWEVLDALAGYTPDDPPPYPVLACPVCNYPVQGISRAPRRAAIFAESYGTRPLICMGEDALAIMEPCGHACEPAEADRIMVAYEEARRRRMEFERRTGMRPTFGSQEFWARY